MASSSSEEAVTTSIRANNRLSGRRSKKSRVLVKCLSNAVRSGRRVWGRPSQRLRRDFRLLRLQGPHPLKTLPDRISRNHQENRLAPGELRNKARWVLANAYLKSGDTTAARGELASLAGTTGPWAARARELVARLGP